MLKYTKKDKNNRNLKKNKLINKEMYVDEIPVGQEDEYFTEEDSATIASKLKELKKKAIPFFVAIFLTGVVNLVHLLLKDKIATSLLQYCFHGVHVVILVSMFGFGARYFAEHRKIARFVKDITENKEK